MLWTKILPCVSLWPVLIFRPARLPSTSTATRPFISCPYGERLSPASVMSFRARVLVTHPDRVYSSPNAHPPPPLCLFELKRSPPTSTVSLRARMLVSHLNRVYSSPNARPIPPLCLFEPERSPPTPTVSLRAQTLVSHPDHVPASPNARLPPRPYLFEPERSSPASTVSFRAQTLSLTVSLRARTLVSHPDHVPASPSAHTPPQPCLLEPERSFPILTTSLRAQMLVFHFGRAVLRPSFY